LNGENNNFEELKEFNGRIDVIDMKPNYLMVKNNNKFDIYGTVGENIFECNEVINCYIEGGPGNDVFRMNGIRENIRSDLYIEDFNIDNEHDIIEIQDLFRYTKNEIIPIQEGDYVKIPLVYFEHSTLRKNNFNRNVFIKNVELGDVKEWIIDMQDPFFPYDKKEKLPIQIK